MRVAAVFAKPVGKAPGRAQRRGRHLLREDSGAELAPDAESAEISEIRLFQEVAA